MKNRKFGITRLLFVTLLILSVCTTTAFAASTAKATNKVRFRTAVVNKLNLEEGATAQVIRGNETIDAFEGMRLESGDTIRTTGDATLYILVDHNKIIRLGKDTEAVLNNTLLGTKVKMTLVKGSMFFNVIEKLPEDESLQFVYGNITISVRGTSGLESVKDGAAVLLLTDGAVDATEELPGGEVVSTPVNAGQKFEYADSNEETGAKSASRISTFTLSELPASVIDEMKNDPALKERIVNNVPLSNGPSGPVYANPDQVDLNFTSTVKGEESMEPSKEIAQIAKQNQTGVTPVPVETVYPEPEKDVPDGGDGKKDPPEEDDPDPIPYFCPFCFEEFESEEQFKSEHVMECGHTVCREEEFESHDKLECGKHFACEIEEGTEYKHQIIADTEGETMCKDPDKWVYCKACDKYILTEDYVPDEHALAACGRHYNCAIDPETAGQHNDLTDCGHHGCVPEWFGHETMIEVGCGHDTCLNFTHWREHIAVIKYVNDQTVEPTYVCQVKETEKVYCPLCGVKTTLNKIKYDTADGHMHYDAEHGWITCSGVRQSVTDFKAAFLNRRFAYRAEDVEFDIDDLFENYLHMHLVKDEPKPQPD